MKATAIAPANIAFIKYWGKGDITLRIPANTSISMNLSEAYSITTVEFSENFSADSVTEGFDKQRIIQHIDRLRVLAGVTHRVRVVTKNSFPTSAGIASSASGFAALTVASAAALGLKISEKELTKLARLGSGSACRSIPDGFVQWDDEYAYSLYSHNYWDLRDILCIVETKEKKISSTDGMRYVGTSPYWETRQKEIPERITRIKKALKEKNFRLFGETTEEDCLSMHTIMKTQIPPLVYWTKTTEDCIKAVKDMRAGGCFVYFTIDAGPNVHIMCEAKDEERVFDRVSRISGVQSVLVNKPSVGARLIDTHLV
jgi:diphosphomevalonate decarboxylase